MEITSETRTAPGFPLSLCFGLMQLLVMLLAFPGTGVAAGNQLDPNNAYFFSAASYNSVGPEGVHFNVVDMNEPTPPAVAIISPSDSAPADGIVSISAFALESFGVTKFQFFVNGLLTAEMATAPYAFSWNTSTLVRGDYNISVKAIDAAGNTLISDTVPVSVAGDIVAPILSINPVSTPATASSQTISGSASDNVAVATVTVQVGSGSATAAALSGNSWSFPLTGLAVGSNLITVWATDGSGNSSSATTSIVVQEPATSATGHLTLLDAQQALNIASGKLTLTRAQLERLDVAPYINGRSQPNGKVDTGDVVVILSKIVGKLL
jgi:chitinase